MKKIRIIALLLTIVMLVGMLAGCGKTISKKDLETDPKTSIEEALKKSFAKSPFGGLLDLKDPEATDVDLTVTPADKDLGHIKAKFTIANKELKALMDFDAKVEGEEIKAQMFLDKENFALKLKELEQIFGTDSVGLGLKDFYNTFKESAWYELLIVQSGLEEELESSDVKMDDIGKIFDSYKEFLKELEEIAKVSQKYSIKESTIEIDGKKIKCFEVEETMADDVAAKMEKALKDFAASISELAGEEIDEEEMDEAFAEMKKSLDKIAESYKTTYFIERKTGAMLKIDAKMEFVEQEYDYSLNMDNYESSDGIQKIEKVSKYNFEINFGADAANTFAPSMNIFVEEDECDTIVVAKSSIDKDAKAFVLDLSFDVKYDDESKASWLNESMNMKFTLNQDNKYTIKMEASGEDDVEFGGTFKVDGAKLDMTIDASDIEDAELGEIVISINFDAKAPSCFEYDDLMKWDEDKIMGLMEKIQELTGSYDDYDDYDDYYEDYPVYDDIIIDNESNAA